MKLAPLVLTLFALPALLQPAAAGTLYRWTDAQGQVHYTDQPPPAGAQNASQKNYKGGTAEASASQGIQQARLRNPVTLFLTPDCGVHCERAKAHLAKRGIPYASKDPVADPEAGLALNPGGGKAVVPTLMVGSEKLGGYLQSAWDAALDKAGYPGGKAPTAATPAPSEEEQP